MGLVGGTDGGSEVLSEDFVSCGCAVDANHHHPMIALPEGVRGLA